MLLNIKYKALTFCDNCRVKDKRAKLLGKFVEIAKSNIKEAKKHGYRFCEICTDDE